MWDFAPPLEMAWRRDMRPHASVMGSGLVAIEEYVGWANRLWWGFLLEEKENGGSVRLIVCLNQITGSSGPEPWYSSWSSYSASRALK